MRSPLSDPDCAPYRIAVLSLMKLQVESDYLPLYDSRMGLGLTVWSPLASGILTGKYGSGTAPEGTRLTREGFKVSTLLPPGE